MDVAQSVRVNAGVERSQVAENESAIRNVVEHCIRNVAVLNPQAARKNCNFVGQYIGGGNRAKDRVKRSPILVTSAWLTRTCQNDARNVLPEPGQVIDSRQLLFDQETEPAMAREHRCLMIDDAGLPPVGGGGGPRPG